jgi:hypothetical protein
MNESEKQFSLTRAASSTSGRAKKQILISNVLVATDWSEPVDFSDHAVRGRLLIIEGSEPAYGGPKTERHVTMFVELQHVTGACCPSVKLYFDVMGLNCDLVETNGKAVPLENVGGWGGRGPLEPRWVVLPYDSTIRLFINSGSRSPLHIHQNGEPWRRWSIKPDETKAYVLSGTFDIATPTNSVLTVTPPVSVGPHDYADWRGKLVFPKTQFVVTTPRSIPSH